MPMRFSKALALGSLLAISAPAYAGPPYLTDDPIPTDLGKWEIFLAAEGQHFSNALEGEAGFDINYGAAKNLQLTVELPVEFEHGGRWHGDLADAAIGAKYMFVEQAEGGIVPSISFYPEVSVPIGAKGYSSKKVGVALPVYIQNDFGPWSLFGGGGYTVNPGVGNRDFWSIGYAVEREIKDGLSIGADVYHQSPEEIGGKASTKVELGGSVEFAPHWSVLGAANAEVQHAHANGSYGFYVGIAFAN